NPWADRGVLCLMKPRWDSIPSGRIIGDPRVTPAPGVNPGKFCEDLGHLSPDMSLHDFAQALHDQGALLFTASPIRDDGMWTWKKAGPTPDDDLSVTTTRGFWGGAAGGTESPDPGFDALDPTYVAGIYTSARGAAVLELAEYKNAAGESRTTSADLS